MVSDTDAYESDDFLTSAEVARLANISKITVTRAAKSGRLKSYRTPGGHYRFRRGDVQAMLTGGAVEASA